MFRKILTTDWKPVWPESKWLARAVLVVTASLLLPLLITGLYNHPSPVDDYVNAVWDNFFAAQKRWYLTWTGRYFSGAVLGLSPLHWGSFAGYRVCVILLIAGFALAFGALVYKALRHLTDAPKSIGIAVACATVLLLFNSMDSLTEGFYWYAGAMTYTLPAAMIALLLCMFMRLDRQRSERPPRSAYLTGILVVAAIIGGNELSMILIDAICLGLWLHYRHLKAAHLSRFYLTLLVACMLCSLVSALAPGNAVRQATITRDVSMFLPNWISYAQRLTLRWISDPFVLTYSGFVLLLTGRCSSRRRPAGLLLAFIVPILVILLIIVPNIYATGRETKPRMENFIFCFFVPAWGYFLVHLAHYTRILLQRAGGASATLQQLGLIVLFVLLLASYNTHDLRMSNLFRVYKGLARRLPQQYDAAQESRYRLLSASAGDSVVLDYIPFRDGNVVYFDDIRQDASISFNQTYAAFWKKAAIRLRADTVSRPLK